MIIEAHLLIPNFISFIFAQHFFFKSELEGAIKTTSLKKILHNTYNHPKRFQILSQLHIN